MEFLVTLGDHFSVCLELFMLDSANFFRNLIGLAFSMTQRKTNIPWWSRFPEVGSRHCHSDIFCHFYEMLTYVVDYLLDQFDHWS